MKPDKNQKARHSVRLHEFDYSRIGLYFVTICAAKRQCIFGQIRGNNILLSRIGEIIEACWIEIPRHFPSVTIETYVVMPNHMHGILAINSKLPHINYQDQSFEEKELFGKPASGSIPTIIRSFKAAASKRARESKLLISGPIWERGFFEHVIRNSREYADIRNYIRRNPVRWAYDEENPNKVSEAKNL